MVVYIVVIFVVTALLSLMQISNSKLKNLIFWSIGVCLFLISALRAEDQSPDYGTYLLMYKDNEGLAVEPTFLLISRFVKLFFDNPIFLFIIYAALAVYVKLKSIKITTDLLFLGILTYISTVYIVQEHAQIRAGVATAFFMLTIKPLHERNWKFFLLFSFTAIMFHYSAAIILFLWFLTKPGLLKWLLWGIIPFGYIIYLLGINIISTALPFSYIQDKLELYQTLQNAGLDSFDSINVFGFGVIFKCLLFYYLLYFRELIRKHNKYIDVILVIYAIGIFCIPAFAIMPVVSYRLSAMLVAVEMLLFPLFYYLFTPRILASIAVILIATVNLFLSLHILL